MALAGTLSSLARVVDGDGARRAWPSTRRARARALLLVPRHRGLTAGPGRAAASRRRRRPDPTRRRARRVGRGRRPSAGRPADHRRRPPPRGRRSGWPSPAPIWSAPCAAPCELAAAYAVEPPSVRRAHRLVPGHPAPAGRRLRARRRDPPASPCTPHGPSTRSPRRRPGRGGGGQGLLRPGGPHGVRDRHPGARRDRQHLGVPGPRLPPAGPALQPTCSVGPGPASTRVLGTGGSEVTDGLRDSPEEAAFRLRLREWLTDEQPGPARLVDRRRLLGRHGRVAPVALRRRLLRHVLAQAIGGQGLPSVSTT